MSAHVLLNILKELGKRDQMQVFAKHLISFSQQVAQIFDSINHMTLKAALSVIFDILFLEIMFLIFTVFGYTF